MAGVKFGLIVPQGWRLDLPNVDARQQFKMVSDTALFAEKLGFQSVWLYDHFLTYPQVRETSCFDSWTTLTALAPMTKKARLGTIVTCSSYRQPALLAKILLLGALAFLFRWLANASYTSAVAALTGAVVILLDLAGEPAAQS
ncbi:MAG: LLM class flavin-dependent oxidoreductase, partial [Nitrososphaerota archaeon]|nr:LLM class flavin-dependent oxidoreductase [Nitrososphaerota archaeon]